MSLFKSAAKFLAKEVASMAANKIGEHVGDAVGNLIGKRIDPNHGKPPEAEPKKAEGEEKKDVDPTPE